MAALHIRHRCCGGHPGVACLGLVLTMMITLLFLGTVEAAKCYVDMKGVMRSTDGSKYDLDKFERSNCTSHGGSNVEKHGCMTRTDKDGIVTRNCATIVKTEETCEEDDDFVLCYCLTDFCNGAEGRARSTWGWWSTTAGAAIIVVHSNRYWR